MRTAPESSATQLPAVVQAALAGLPQQLKPVFDDVLVAVGPLLAVEAAEAGAAEAAATLAWNGAESETARSQRVTTALNDLEDREQERWQSGLAALDSMGDGEEDVDALARALGVDDMLQSQATFDAFMEDDDRVFTLGPPDPVIAVDEAERLARIARLTMHGPLANDQVLPAALFEPRLLNPSTHAGHWINTADGHGILLGDGSAVTVRERRVCWVRQPAANGSPAKLRTARWASGTPPQLQDHAAAALASCLAAREATGPDVDHLPLWLTVGVSVDVANGTQLATIWKTIQQLRKTRSVHQAAAPLLQLAFEVSRLRATMAIVTETHPTYPVIDVGRVRWCELSQRPIFWLPVLSDHPDVVGGPDRAWTTDIPAAGAMWHGTSPALRMDPTWSAALVIAPGDSNIWCVDRARRWWTLDSDYEAIVLARRAHHEPWCDAMDWMHEQVPVQLEAANQRSAALDELRAQELKSGQATGSSPTNGSANQTRGAT